MIPQRQAFLFPTSCAGNSKTAQTNGGAAVRCQAHWAVEI